MIGILPFCDKLLEGGGGTRATILHLSYRGHPAGDAQMTELTTYCPYTQAELVELRKQLLQNAGKPLVASLLCLWNLWVDGIMCMD